MLARLVVLDDAACAERVDVDPVDLPGQRHPVAEIEPALQLLRGALAAEQDLEAARDELQRRLRLLVDDRLEVAPQRLVELARLHLGHLHPHALDRLVEAGAHQPRRIVGDAAASSFSTPSSFGSRVKNLNSAECATDPRSFASTSRVDRARIEEPVDEPRGRAVGEPFELGDVERRAAAQLLEHERMRDPRRPVERPQRAVEPALPAVRARERAGGGGVGRGELRQRAQPLPLRRRVVERPRQRRERTPARPAPHVLRVEHGLHLVPERARLARAAVVGGRLADEVEPLQRPACTPCRRGSGRG